MNSKTLFSTLLSSIFPLLNLCIFLILSSPLPRKSQAQGVDVDPYFQVCSAEPETCGDGQPIKFPFHIPNKQNRSCGYPGFELSCNNNGQPTINIQNNNYIIHNISYETQIIRISNSDFLNTSSCIPLTQNISLPFGVRFELAPVQTHMNLLYGCNASKLDSTTLGYFSYPGCDHWENKNTSVVVLSENDPKLRNISKACTIRVVAPVEPYERENGTDGIQRALRNGFRVKWKASECSICQGSGGRCGFNYSDWQFKCFCPDRPHAKQCISDKKRRKWVIPLAVGCPVLLFSICLGFNIWSCYKKKHASSNLLARAITYSRSDLEGGSVYFGVPLFSYSELQEATNNFDIEKELGDGGFGTVYYGKLRDGREVAVKRLYEHNYKRVEQFMNEVEILTCLRHTNLVSLYGCTSRHSRELLLVYEYIPNGTVADHIHGDRATPGSLTWPTRMSIAIETARALAYLHASDIIHRDVKTNNILLDNNFSVKVADFGLSRLFPTDVTHVSTAPQGTPGYVDPEYHQCYQLTSKSDVYSFGVVLIELISSLTAVDIGRHRHEINLANLAINKIEKCAFHELIDPHLGFHSDDEVKRMTISVASLAFQCVQQDKDLRPSMDEVLNELQNIQSCKDVPKDQEKAYEDAGMLNVDTQTSPDCDEVGLLKTKQLPPSPNSVTDNWTSRSTTPTLNVDTQTSPDCDEVGLLKTKQLPPSPISVTGNWTSRSTTPTSSK